MYKQCTVTTLHSRQTPVDKIRLGHNLIDSTIYRRPVIDSGSCLLMKHEYDTESIIGRRQINGKSQIYRVSTCHRISRRTASFWVRQKQLYLCINFGHRKGAMRRDLHSLPPRLKLDGYGGPDSTTSNYRVSLGCFREEAVHDHSVITGYRFTLTSEQGAIITHCRVGAA